MVTLRPVLLVLVKVVAVGAAWLVRVVAVGARTLVVEPGGTTAGTASAAGGSCRLRSECGFPGERGLIGKGVVLEAAEDNSGTIFVHLFSE
jgi:hypothetical protein